MDKTFIKGLTLIEVLAASAEPRGVTSLAQELGLTKSNVHRLLITLASRGYVRRTKASSYELGSKIWELGILVRSRLSLIKVSQQHMATLAEKTGESVHLSILDGFEAVYVDKIESHHPIAAYTHVGGRAPAWCVATGKAMLAFNLDDSRVLKPHLKRYTSQTIVDLAALNREFELIRINGYAINRGEWREGVFGIAAPIMDATEELVGGIGISGPSTRFRPKQIKVWAEMVVDAANIISQALGRRLPNTPMPVHGRTRKA